MANIEMSSSLSLPDDAVTQTFAFLARRGAGKSYGAMKLAEGMLGIGAQIVALDPVGIWYSLRIAADGKGRGFELPIFGGLNGDIPLEPGAGALIADLLVERGIPAVLDVSMFRKADRKRFATDFAEQIFHRKKEHRSPLHLFIEEAQVFIPQRVMIDEARMLGAFEDIIKLGRNFGIGATLISQRPQAVNKDALNQTEALFVLQTNGAQERKALTDWIVDQGIASKAIVDELPGLPIGTAYLWSPSWLRKLEKVKIGKRSTYNASATPTSGAKRVEPRPLTAVELAEVEKAMAATIERAKADDPKLLRARIAELERELAKKPAATTERVEVPVLSPQAVEALDYARSEVDAAEAALVAFVEEYGEALRGVKDELAKIEAKVKPPIPARPEPVARAERPRAPDVPPVRREAPEGADSTITPALRKVLEAIAMRHPKPSTRAQVAALAGYSPSGGGFNNYLGSLRSRGLIEYPGTGDVALTAAGASIVADAIGRAPATSEQVIELWIARAKSAGRVLRVIVDAYPRTITRAEIADSVGMLPTGGGFNNYLGHLRGLGLIEYPAAGVVRASDDLFPTGKPR